MLQSDGTSYCGDVVLDSLNIVYSNVDSILDQKFSFGIFIMKFLNLMSDWKYAYLKNYGTLTTRNS